MVVSRRMWAPGSESLSRGAGQELQRHLSGESRVSGAVAFAHPSGPEPRDDFVRADGGAGSECHGREYSEALRPRASVHVIGMHFAGLVLAVHQLVRVLDLIGEQRREDAELARLAVRVEVERLVDQGA